MEKGGVINEVVTHIRDYTYEQVCGVSSNNFPDEYEIPRENTGTLRNQKFDDCVANVIAQLAEAFWGEKHSEQFAYGSLRQPTSTSKGMITSVAMEMWAKIGTIPAKQFDISAEMPEIKQIVANYPEIYDMAKKYKISGFVQFTAHNRDEQIKDAFIRYNRGLLAISTKGFSVGSHCILLTGWNDKTNKYKFKNSWGPKYGDNGFSEIDKDKINTVYMPIFEPLKLPFTDVDENRWSAKSIKNMYFSGMMNGISETLFDPEGVVTREQIAVMFDRLMKYIDENNDIFKRTLEDKEKYTKK